jgi:hypothetical protein
MALYPSSSMGEGWVGVRVRVSAVPPTCVLPHKGGGGVGQLCQAGEGENVKAAAAP